MNCLVIVRLSIFASAIFSWLAFPNQLSAQCGIHELSDEAFIDAVRSPGNPCFTTLFDKHRAESIQKMDSLIVMMDHARRDHSYYGVSSLFSDEIQSQVSEVDSGDSWKDRKSAFMAVDSVTYYKMIDLTQALMIFTGMHADAFGNEVVDYVSYIDHAPTARLLYHHYEFEVENDGMEDHPVSPYRERANLQTVADWLETLEGEQFCMYQSNSSSLQKVKGIEFYHENDVFIPVNTHDRDYTGGFRFAVSTDYFKSRYLNLGWLTSGFVVGRRSRRDAREDRLKHPRNKVLTYQVLAAGGFGYTPYIRFHNNFSLADTFHQHDRPFGSYVYLGRSKYRLWPSGLARHQGEFQIGQVGLFSGDKIQAVIHKDLTIDAQRVYGWEKQIGSGGRYLFQVNHKLDLMLFSTTNRYRSIFGWKKPRTDEDLEKEKYCDNMYNRTYKPIGNRYAGANVFGELDLRFGGFLTSAGAGLRFSTLDFTKQSGQKYILARRNSRFDFGWHFDAGIHYRYVIHNSMLEGLGIIKTFENDPYDEDDLDFYTLRYGQVQRHLWLVDWGINVRWRKMTMYYRQTFHRLEYEVDPLDYEHPDVLARVNPDDLQEYRDKWIKEHAQPFDSNYYIFGVVGASWLLN